MPTPTGAEVKAAVDSAHPDAGVIVVGWQGGKAKTFAYREPIKSEKAFAVMIVLGLPDPPPDAFFGPPPGAVEARSATVKGQSKGAGREGR
jgi:hypothetical protein